MRTICRLKARLFTLMVLILGLTCPNVPPVSAREEPGLRVEFGRTGLQSLTADGVEYLADGRVEVTGAFFQKPDGRVYAADVEEFERIFDAQDRRDSLVFPWGRVEATCEAGEGRIDLGVNVTNNRRHETLVGLYVSPLRLKLPRKPKIQNRSYLFYMRSSVSHNLGSPGVVGADLDRIRLAFCNEQLVRPLAFGLGRPVEGNARIRPVLAYTGRHTSLKRRFPFIERPVPSGRSDHWEMSVRFAALDTSLNAIASDLYAQFAELFPRKLRWPDRRPIASIFVAGGGNLPQPSNPRGYRFARKLDLRTDEGREKFPEKALEFADKCVNVGEKMGAQGIVVWNLEGQEYKHPITYLGDPRSLPPEMEAVADAFFQKFNDAGLRTGLTIRPSRPLRPAYDDQVEHVSWSSPVRYMRNLHRKIAYAKERWGCSIFYIDSNLRWSQDPFAFPGLDGSGYSAMIDERSLAELQRRHPDVLLVPEHESMGSYAYAAPYVQPRNEHSFRPSDSVLRTYPGAFSVINAVNDKALVFANMKAVVRAAVAGQAFFARGWGGIDFKLIERLMKPAAALAPFQARVTDEAIEVGRTRLEDAASLRDHLEAEIDRDAPLRKRRVFVISADGTSAAQRKAVFEAITRAGGVIAWHQPQMAEWGGHWHPENPLRPLDQRAAANVYPHQDSSVKVVLTNASSEPRVLSFKIHVEALGLNVSKAADIQIVHRDRFADEAVEPPAAGEARGIGVKRADDDDGGFLREMAIDARQAEGETEDFEFRSDNFRLTGNSLRVLVEPFSYRVLLIRAR